MMPVKIFDHTITKIFLDVCNDVRRYCGINVDTPAKVRRAYQEAIEDYRMMLDGYGIKMPPPKYPYSIKNKNTWKYIDCYFDDKLFVRWVINPDWKYLQTT